MCSVFHSFQPSPPHPDDYLTSFTMFTASSSTLLFYMLCVLIHFTSIRREHFSSLHFFFIELEQIWIFILSSWMRKRERVRWEVGIGNWRGIMLQQQIHSTSILLCKFFYWIFRRHFYILSTRSLLSRCLFARVNIWISSLLFAYFGMMLLTSPLFSSICKQL